jgi:hypothetical protein
MIGDMGSVYSRQGEAEEALIRDKSRKMKREEM